MQPQQPPPPEDLRSREFPSSPSSSFPPPAALIAFQPEDPLSSLTELTLDDDAITLEGFNGSDYKTAPFWMAAPLLPNMWVLLGELTKFVAISRQRVTDIAVNSPFVNLSLVGEPGETVELTAAFKEGGQPGLAGGTWKLCLIKVQIDRDGLGKCTVGSWDDCEGGKPPVQGSARGDQN